MASPIADLVIRISADSADFQNNLRNAEKWTDTFGKKIDTSFSGIATASVAMVTAVAAGTAAIVSAFADTADQALKTANSIGTNVEELSRLRFAFDLSGSSAEVADSSISKMMKNIGDASRGIGESGQALKDLGLNAQQLASMGPEQAFLTITDALNRVQDASQRASVGAAIFGKQFTEGGVTNVVAAGSEAIRDMGKELDDLGGTLKTGVAVEAERYHDNMTRMQAVSTGFAQKLSAAVLPTVNLLAEDMINASKQSDALSMTVDFLSGTFKTLVTAGISVKWALGTVVDFLGAIGIAISRLLSRDFKGAASAFTEFGEDRQKEAEADAQRIVDLWTAIPGQVKQQMAAQKTGPAIVLHDTKAAEEREKAQQKQLKSYLETLRAEDEALARSNAIKLAEQREYQESYLRGLGINAEEYARINDFERQNSEQKYDTITGLASGFLSSMSRTNKKAFEASKTLAIAEAVVNTYRAITGAFASGASSNIYVALAKAAVAAAFGFAQVRAIQATQYGGGGGRGAVGMAAPTGAGDVGGGGFTTGSNQRPQVTVVVQDDALLSGATVRRIFEGLNELSQDGGEFVVTGSAY